MYAFLVGEEPILILPSEHFQTPNSTTPGFGFPLYCTLMTRGNYFAAIRLNFNSCAPDINGHFCVV